MTAVNALLKVTLGTPKTKALQKFKGHAVDYALLHPKVASIQTAWQGETLLATGMLLPAHLINPNVPKDIAAIFSFATNPLYQGQGLGKQLLVEIEQKAREKGYSSVILSAVTGAETFYEQNGFVKLNKTDGPQSLKTGLKKGFWKKKVWMFKTIKTKQSWWA